ncbi:MAG: LacI family DNA-binding transcriptional regulator [Flavobacteriaceae bacterium]
MTKKTTIYDIAEKLNITAATVSRALNGNTKISEATRKLVLETAKEMNYEQNKIALALKSGKSFNVGVIVPRIDSAFFASVIKGIEEELKPEGYHVIICQTYDQKESETANITSLINAQVDGILMSISISKTEDDSGFQNVIKKQIPLVFFDRSKAIKGVSSVVIDDYKGAYAATTHLIKQGCKRIAHFSNNRKLQIFENRYQGYKQALLDHNLDFDESLVLEATSKLSEGKRLAQHLLTLSNPPDAIFSVSDFTALGAIQEFKSQGLKIPDDICVVGFSNEPFTQLLELSITSVDQAPIEMGRQTARVFLDEVQDKKNKKEKNVVLEPELIIRKSSLK